MVIDIRSKMATKHKMAVISRFNELSNGAYMYNVIFDNKMFRGK